MYFIVIKKVQYVKTLLFFFHRKHYELVPILPVSLSFCLPPAVSPRWCRRSRGQLPSCWRLESAQTWSHRDVEPQYGGSHTKHNNREVYSQKTVSQNNVTENIERALPTGDHFLYFHFDQTTLHYRINLIEQSAVLPAVIFMLGPLFSAGQWPGSDGGETDDAATTDGGWPEVAGTGGELHGKQTDILIYELLFPGQSVYGTPSLFQWFRKTQLFKSLSFKDKQHEPLKFVQIKFLLKQSPSMSCYWMWIYF